MTGQPRRIVKVAKIPKEEFKGKTWEELACLICWYYPQYTFNQARKLSYKRTIMLLKTAKRMEAKRYFNLTQIAAAPHTRKGKGVTQLSSQFEELMNG